MQSLLQRLQDLLLLLVPTVPNHILVLWREVTKCTVQSDFHVRKSVGRFFGQMDSKTIPRDGNDSESQGLRESRHWRV